MSYSRATRARNVAVLLSMMVLLSCFVGLRPAVAETPSGSTPVTLPFFGHTQLFPAQGDGGPGNASFNASVSAACNAGSPLGVPQWYALPATADGKVYAKIRAYYEPRATVPLPAGVAFVDATSGDVLSCGSNAGVALEPWRPVLAVSYFAKTYPLCPDPVFRADNTGLCDAELDLYLFASQAVGSPDNADWRAARPITALPFVDVADTTFDHSSLNAPSQCLGYSALSPTLDSAAWWSYTPTVTGPPPTLVVQSRTPGVALRAEIAELTPTGPVFAQDGNDGCTRTTLTAGVTYGIVVFSARDAYYEQPLVTGGAFSLSVGGPTQPGQPQTTEATLDKAAATATFGWTAPSDGGAPITGYRVERFGSGEAVVSVVLPASARSYTFTGLAPWQYYQLSVRAINVVGDGPGAGPTFQMSAPVPSEPYLLGEAAVVAGNRSATVTWSPPNTSGDAPISGYRIRRYAGSSTSPEATATVGAGATTFTATGLTNGRPYSFDVTAINSFGFGKVSSRSSVATPAVPTAPGAPQGVVAGSDGDKGTAVLSWYPPDRTGGSPITGYRVSRDGVDTGTTGAWSTTVSADTYSLTFAYLQPWDTYNLTVQAINAVGASVGVTRTVTLTAAVPSAPTTVTAARAIGGVRVHWATPEHAGNSAISGYRVRRFVGTSKTVAATTTLPATARWFLATGLTSGTAYSFDVTAINAAGDGRVSPKTAAVAPATAPAAPTALNATADAVARSATLTWAVPGSNGGSVITGYRVSRDGRDQGTTGPWSTTLPASARSQTFLFMVPGDTYTITVQAINAVGSSVGASRTVVVGAARLAATT